MAPRALLFIGLASSASPCSAAMRSRDQSLLQVAATVPAATKAKLGIPEADVVDRGFLGQGYNLMETDPRTFESLYSTEVYDPDTMQYHACKPPNFKWSVVDHACKCDLECKNGGVLDMEECVCQCPSDRYHGWTGSDCSDPENVYPAEVYDPDLVEYHTCKPPNFKWSMEEHTCKCDLECDDADVLDVGTCECVAPTQVAENSTTIFGGPKSHQ